MEKRDIVQLTTAGLLIWIIGTVYYAYVGPKVLETTGIRYWTSFTLSPILSAWLCIVIMRRRRIAPVPDGHFKFLHLWPGQTPPLDSIMKA